jgi:Ca2+-transporting ATPase
MEKNEVIKKYWALHAEQVFELLQSTPEGLTEEAIQERQMRWGKNMITDKSKHTALAVFAEQFLSPLIWILLFAAGVTLYLGEIIEAMVIFAAVGLNIGLAFYQEHKADHTIEKLKSYIKNRTVVLRDGMHDIDAVELVPGDIISITYGNRIPADGLLLEATNLRVDESILTGESLPVEKRIGVIQRDEIAERKNSVFCGTYVTEGVALVLVTATGAHTEIGKIAETVTSTKRVKTPVQHAVNQISWYIFLVALVIVGLIFFLGITRGENLFDMLLLSSAVAVGAVPEALPITLTVILSVGVLAISKKGGLIRKLSAAETLGSTTLILTDKTGTLTKAQLSLDALYSAEDLLDTGVNVLEQSQLSALTDAQQRFIKTASSNIQATVEKLGNDPTGWAYAGGAFDVVILKTMYQFGIEPASAHKGNLIVPFNSTNKYSISLQGNTETTILGAPDILIQASRWSKEQQSEALAKITTLAEEGKRIIALAKRSAEVHDVIAGLEMIAFFVFSDPIREEVIPAIADMHKRGVQVKVITGDMIGTARAIARRVGIPTEDHEVLTGDEINNLDDEQLTRLLPGIKVFARTTPEDKMRIGKLYQSLGHVVAMTGDGVNDAPALKAMDIGISLGSGSDVAKSSADMLLLDNNFKTITDTISEGHKIRSRIQKVFVYLMSSSLDEVFVIAGALIASLPLPISGLQIIWVNMLTGTLPALAFAYESNHAVEKNAKDTKIFNFKTKFMALGIGTLSSAMLFMLYFVLHRFIGDIDTVRSVFFACFGTYILIIAYSFRDLDRLIWTYNPFSNARLNFSVLIGLLLIIATVAIPVVGKVFHTAMLPVQYIWIVVVWNVLNIGVVECAKWCMKKIQK